MTALQARQMSEERNTPSSLDEIYSKISYFCTKSSLRFIYLSLNLYQQEKLIADGYKLTYSEFLKEFKVEW